MTLSKRAKAALEGATPGPWYVHDFTAPEINDAPRAIDVTVSCTHPDHITVAEMHGGYMGLEGLNQAREDAHLIALAPEMARALIAAERGALVFERWLTHEKELCEASGDRAGTIAYSRALAAFRAANGDDQ